MVTDGHQRLLVTKGYQGLLVVAHGSWPNRWYTSSRRLHLVGFQLAEHLALEAELVDEFAPGSIKKSARWIDQGCQGEHVINFLMIKGSDSSKKWQNHVLHWEFPSPWALEHTNLYGRTRQNVFIAKHAVFGMLLTSFLGLYALLPWNR